MDLDVHFSLCSICTGTNYAPHRTHNLVFYFWQEMYKSAPTKLVLSRRPVSLRFFKLILFLFILVHGYTLTASITITSTQLWVIQNIIQYIQKYNKLTVKTSNKWSMCVYNKRVCGCEVWFGEILGYRNILAASCTGSEFLLVQYKPTQ